MICAPNLLSTICNESWDFTHRAARVTPIPARQPCRKQNRWGGSIAATSGPVFPNSHVFISVFLVSVVSYSIASIGRRGARLGCREATIDRVRRAGRVTGVVGQQEGDKARYVFGCSVTAKGNRLCEGLVAPGEHFVGELERHATGDWAGRRCVDPDPARPLFDRGGLGHADDGVLGSHVGYNAGAAHKAEGA